MNVRRAVGVFTTAAQTPNLVTLSRPMRIGVIPRQAVYRLPTALSLIRLTRSHRFLRGRFGTLDRSITGEPPSVPVTRAICPFQHLADIGQANDCHLLARGSRCSHFPSAWPHLQYCHALVGAEPTPTLWHERARYPALMQPSVSILIFLRTPPPTVWGAVLVGSHASQSSTHQGPLEPPLLAEREASITCPRIKDRVVPRETSRGTCIIKTFLNFTFRPGSSVSFSQFSIILP